MAEEPTEPTAPAEPEPAAPEPTEPEPDKGGGKNWEEEASKWKALARKHESTAKANAAKAKQFDEVEAKNKTEAEKLADAKAKAEKDASAALSEAAKLRAAVKHGLSEEDLELLGTGTPEEIEERAERLATRLAATKPKPDFGGGHRGPDVGGIEQWTQSDLSGKNSAQIEAARKAGHLDRLMGKAK